MNYNKILRIVAIVFVAVVLASGFALVLGTSQAGTTTYDKGQVSGIDTSSALATSNASIAAQDPNPPDHGPIRANYTPGTYTHDVSDTNYVYIEVYGAGQERFGSRTNKGGFVSAYVNVSDIDTFDVYVPDLDQRDIGFDNGEVAADSSCFSQADDGTAGTSVVLFEGQPEQTVLSAGGAGGAGSATAPSGCDTAEGGDGGGSAGAGGLGGAPGENGEPGGAGIENSLDVDTHASHFEQNVSWVGNVRVYDHQSFTPTITDVQTDTGPSVGEVSLSVSIDDQDFSEEWGDNVTIEFRDNSDDSVIGSDTLTSAGTGTATFDVSAGTNEWYANVTDSSGNSVETNVQSFSTTGPTVESLSPSNGTGVSGDVTLEATVSDGDFNTQWRDELTVQFYDGETDSLIGSDTVGSNGTATATDTANAGSNSWYAVVTDHYGDSDTSATNTFTGPRDVRVYSEENGTTLITGTQIDVSLYGENGQIFTRNTTDGTFSIESLPDQNYFVQASAEGYYGRTIYLNDLYANNSIYLLDNSTDVETAQFLLEDTTGTYTSESRLILERPISDNGNTEYETIIYDSFGTEGITTQLESGVRYRISIETSDGERQVLGPYRAELSETVTISPSSGIIGIDEAQDWTFGASYLENDDGDEVAVRFSDPENEVSQISIDVYERGNESNTLAEGDTYSDPSDVQVTYDVPDAYNDTSWRVEVDVTAGGETTTIERIVGPNAQTVPAMLDPMWRKVIAVLVLLAFGMGFSVLNKAVGGIALGAVGGMLWWAGWLEGVTIGAAITLYLFLAVMYAIFAKSIR